MNECYVIIVEFGVYEAHAKWVDSAWNDRDLALRRFAYLKENRPMPDESKYETMTLTIRKFAGGLDEVLLSTHHMAPTADIWEDA